MQDIETPEELTKFMNFKNLRFMTPLNVTTRDYESIKRSLGDLGKVKSRAQLVRLYDVVIDLYDATPVEN